MGHQKARKAMSFIKEERFIQPPPIGKLELALATFLTAKAQSAAAVSHRQHLPTLPLSNSN